MAYLYRHIRLDKNEPFYIGIGSDANYKRANDKSGRNKIWKGVANRTEYEVEILFDNLSWQDACKKEKEFISLYGRIDKHNGILVNLTDGGDGAFGVIMSEERKKQISILAKGNKSRTGQKTSEETKRKMSESQKGLKRKPFTEQGWENFMKARIATRGRKQSIEEIENRRKSLIGKKRTQESKDKISKANKGKIVSDESKRKMSEYWTGRPRQKMSEDTKIKIGEANRKAHILKNKKEQL
jgi:hypothetical protein